MPHLTRQNTLASVQSWWTDSNSLLRYGPTINLHAAAKPLMKLMYHRQAKGFIRENKGRALSTEMVEIYMSYLPYVSTFYCVSSLADVMMFLYVGLCLIGDKESHSAGVEQQKSFIRG
jgi:hypothetical protein